jgi:hypothetical protein
MCSLWDFTQYNTVNSTKGENKMQKAKVIDSDGKIVEGQLLTPGEAEIFEDELFDPVAFNVAVRGTYFSGQSIRNTLAYILMHYTMTKRVEPAPPIGPADPTAINI